MTYTFSTGSGYLNSPPRVVMIDNDNRPGSYPSHASPIDIRRSQGSDGTRPYRDIVIPAAVSPYAKATLRFITGLPTSGATITLTSTSATVSTFTFKANPTSFNPSPGAYEIDTAGIWVGSTDTSPTSIEAARLISLRFIDAVSRATGCLITASPSPVPGEVVLTQVIPGTAGNTAISTTVSALRLEVENFAGGSDSTDIRYPYGQVVIDSDPSTSEVIRRVLKSTRSGTLSAPGTPNPQMLIGPSDQHPYVNYSPFDESDTQQSFGLPGGSEAYGTQVQLYDDFFTRGSTLGPLDEPLWVKDKIEIDLTPVGETTLLATTGSAVPGPASNFPMAYFNFDTKRWEPIGFGHGRNLPAGATTLQENLERQYLGFSQGWGNNLENSSTSQVEILDPQLLSTYTGTKKVFKESGWVSPIDTFGFPLHPKYHATGSQQLNVTSLVDRPFLIEKIVYEFSASMPNLQSSLSAGNFYLGGGGAFFILNQRKANPDPGQENSYTNTYVSEKTGPNREFGTPRDGGSDGPSGDFYSFHYENGSIPRTMQLSTSGPSVYVDTIRDLVTFARIGTIWDTYDDEIDQFLEPGFPHPANFMDLAINVPVGGTFSGKYTVAAPVRSPSQNSAIANIELGTPPVSPNNITSVWAAKDSSTRNSIDISTGRSYRGEFFGPEIAYRAKGWATSKLIFAPKTDNVTSPYLILPGDKLIFGWQSPMSYILNDIDIAKTLKILPGAGKLILYGSYLQDDKPVHNIYKDQLNSDALHEAIPAGPWVLDRFESEPQMMYSCSMREEHVTGTMLTRNADGSLSVTPVNDLSIGGVRAVSARVSDGTVKQRWSFFRNNRLFDSDEQYYDSMQPNPLALLTKPTNVKPIQIELAGIPNFKVRKLLIMYPGENVNAYWGTAPGSRGAYMNSAANKKFIGSFPFEAQYSGIERLKRINSKIFNKQLEVIDVNTGTSQLQIFGSNASTFDSIESFIHVQGDAGGSSQKNSMIAASYGSFKQKSFISDDTSGVYAPPVDIYWLLSYFSNINYDTNISSKTSQPLIRDPQIKDDNDVNYLFSRFMGCFGSGPLGIFRYSAYSLGLNTDTVVANSLQTVRSFGLEYRGVKHGLINPTPLFSSAVFNGTQFGQFRDMMEQRQYTRFSLTDNTLTDAAVSVQFINRSATPGALNITSGSATNSSNISQFATSEHPYDDGLVDAGQIWDRDTALPETLIAL